MNTNQYTGISVQTTVNSPIENVWEKWTDPKDIIKWNFASDEWQCPKADNELMVNGKFNYKMEAKDGSFEFDFWGIYDKIIINELIEYTMGDGRKVKVVFEKEDDKTKITETFEAENTNSKEMQKSGWQAILDNFKKHAES